MIFTLLLSSLLGGVGQDAQDIAFYEKRIRPVLVQHCYRCHADTARRLRGGLRLDVARGWLDGGHSGAAVFPGDPGKSLLIEALRYSDPDLQMPPRGKLDDRVIDDFVRWISIGAPAPEEAEAPDDQALSDDTEMARAPLWSFQPVDAPAVPAVSDRGWPRTDIDRFVLARLEAEGLSPVGDADPATLFRRLSFDLIGLPPAPEEIRRFLGTPTEAALDEAIDTLLSSSHFGERWGRHWLDVARYADSTGGGRTRALEEAWRYRDYVIDAFNADKPFDVFVREQVAGDLLPADTPDERRENLIATGFLALGPHNYENQDKDALRMDVVDEQIDTTGRAFLGMTLGCARCHDHKFDPVPTRDYYALAGIFRSTKMLTPGNVSGFLQRRLPLDPEQSRELEAQQGAIADCKARLETARRRATEIQAKQGKLDPGQSKQVPSSRLRGLVLDDTAAERVGFWKASVSQPRFVDQGYLHDDNAEKGEKSITFTIRVPSDGVYDVRLAYSPGTNREPSVPVEIIHADGTSEARVDQRKPPPIEGLLVSLGHHRFVSEQPGRVRISNAGTRAYVVADAIQLLPIDGSLEATEPVPGQSPEEKARLESAARRVQDEISALERELKELEASAIDPPQAIAVTDQDDPSDWRVHIRGEIRNLGEKVPRGFLSGPVLEASWPIPEGESGRLQLAEWLTHPDHPLTARVWVNRVWHHLFGAGLVRTVDNFGRAGEPPSHPELLDHLARRFVESGWSVKSLIREIVRSRVYRLGSGEGLSHAERDPQNRWLWRHRTRRLDAESLRDAMLAVSGQLDRRAGGPSIRAPGQGVQKKVEYGYEYRSRRRSVYVPVFRNTLLDVFEIFDFADPNRATGRRGESTRATQALYLMNSPFVLEQAARWSVALRAEEGLTAAERLERAYLTALGREPRREELELAMSFLEGRAPEAAWTELCHALLACVDFQFLR